MKKEKQIKTHQRRTKGGKTVIVRAHKAKYDAAEELKKSLTKKKGAGDELESRRSKVEDVSPDLGFTDAEYKEWYHWDQEGDPKNKTALKVEKALIAKMGKRAYNKYFNDLSDSYSARGHTKAYKSLVAEHTETPTPKTPKTTKSAKSSSDTIEHYDQFNNKHVGKKVGKPFKFKDDVTSYDAQFVTDGKGRYGYVLKEEGSDEKYYVGINDDDSMKDLPAGLRKAAKANGLSFANGEFFLATDKPKSKKSKRLSPKETDDFLSGKQGAINPQPKEKTSWGHTSREKGKAVRPLDMRGQANYEGIKASGIKLPKKFTYDSDTRSDWYDSFRTKDSASIENVVSQAKKAKWKKGGSGKMVRYTSPDGRVHILVNKGDKSASIFYR